MSVPEIEAFLTHLAQQKNVAVSTQNQTFSSLLFLYRHVLHIQLEDRINTLPTKKSHYLPTILTKDPRTGQVLQYPLHPSGWKQSCKTGSLH
jgi:hypothetical protein